MGGQQDNNLWAKFSSQVPIYVAFTFSNGFLKSNKYFVTYEYYMKFTFQCWYLKFYGMQPCSFIYLVHGYLYNVTELCYVIDYLATMPKYILFILHKKVCWPLLWMILSPDKIYFCFWQVAGVLKSWNCRNPV